MSSLDLNDDPCLVASEAISDDQVKNVGESEAPVDGCVQRLEGRAEVQDVEEMGERTDFPLQPVERVAEDDVQNTGIPHISESTASDEDENEEVMKNTSTDDVHVDADDELMEEAANQADDEMDQEASRVPRVNFDDTYAADPCRYFLDKDPSEMNKCYMEGLEFNSCDDAFKFYRTYGHIIGFSVRKGSSRRDKKTNELVMKEFSCNKAGWRMDKWNKLENRKKEPKAVTRTGCVAHMRVRLNKRTGKWEVSWFEGQHNHDLAKRKQRHLLRSNRQVTEGSIQFARAWRRTGARPCQIMSYLATEAGGFQSVGFTRKDLSNRLYIRGRNSVEAGNIHTAITYLETKANSDPGFYVSYAVDKDNTFERAFWSDSISRADYPFFSDVIAFDTTYKKNGLNLPLLVFVGVNHHHQTIIFAFALLTVENEEAFVWSLEEFLKCMSNRETILINGEYFQLTHFVKLARDHLEMYQRMPSYRPPVRFVACHGVSLHLLFYCSRASLDLLSSVTRLQS
ncbi:hypothetical protein CCACVL1_11123 [Corchorus capsularis]|uniref:Uncharacterized protein n=1 Tax=Corchorus capsularis TaxID=210143 RepID=A0A1R3IMT6_COCAP|nr:hypothetical protein CCACVL1_11123 [Corchorus capsularis]